MLFRQEDADLPLTYTLTEARLALACSCVFCGRGTAACVWLSPSSGFYGTNSLATCDDGRAFRQAVNRVDDLLTSRHSWAGGTVRAAQAREVLWSCPCTRHA